MDPIEAIGVSFSIAACDGAELTVFLLKRMSEKYLE